MTSDERIPVRVRGLWVRVPRGLPKPRVSAHMAAATISSGHTFATFCVVRRLRGIGSEDLIHRLDDQRIPDLPAEVAVLSHRHPLRDAGRPPSGAFLKFGDGWLW